MRLVQLRGRGSDRRVGIVEEPWIRLTEAPSVYDLVRSALAGGSSLGAALEGVAGAETVSYDEVYAGRGEWRLLPPIDHPGEPARCMISGTGLTHLASAENRNAMHAAGENLTDSMRMYRWGEEGGRPREGEIGVAPEWFYKGDGSIVRAHGEALTVPAHAEDGGEEPEIAGVYVIADDGTPVRVGMATGNEFSDHVFEKKNYLYLAGSKLRTCSLGPELVVDPDFASVTGRVAVEREGAVLWESPIRSGEAAMCHSLANMEHHHFKYAQHRRPGDVHVHFFGASAFSFGAGVRLQDGDAMIVQWDGFGRALRNPVAVEAGPQQCVRVKGIG